MFESFFLFCVSLQLYYFADCNNCPKKNSPLLTVPEYQVLNESAAVSTANASAFIVDQDNSTSFDALSEPEVDKILIEKMVEIFKTPTNFNWAW